MPSPGASGTATQPSLDRHPLARELEVDRRLRDAVLLEVAPSEHRIQVQRGGLDDPALPGVRDAGEPRPRRARRSAAPRTDRRSGSRPAGSRRRGRARSARGSPSASLPPRRRRPGCRPRRRAWRRPRTRRARTAPRASRCRSPRACARRGSRDRRRRRSRSPASIRISTSSPAAPRGRRGEPDVVLRVLAERPPAELDRR